jgi:hypothetical protein
VAFQYLLVVDDDENTTQLTGTGVVLAVLDFGASSVAGSNPVSPNVRWHWTDVRVVYYFHSMLEKVLSPTMPNHMVYASSHIVERD